MHIRSVALSVSQCSVEQGLSPQGRGLGLNPEAAFGSRRHRVDIGRNYRQARLAQACVGPFSQESGVKI